MQQAVPVKGSPFLESPFYPTVSISTHHAIVVSKNIYALTWKYIASYTPPIENMAMMKIMGLII
jgi:hypothetical protein